MGNGRLLIGQGYGDATVWNANPAIQQFADVLGRQKAEQQAKDQALINQISQLKPDVIRDADKEDYQNKYNDWKQSAIAANQLPKNSKGRLDALATAQSKYDDLGEFINSSKQQKADEHGVLQMRLLHPHIFSDAADQQLVKSTGSPMSSPDFIPSSHFGNLERYVDPEKVDADLEKARLTALKSNPNKQKVQWNGAVGNNPGTWLQEQNKIPYDGENGVAHMLLTAATLNKNFKKSLEDRYGNIVSQSGDPASTLALRVHQYAADRGWDKGWDGSKDPTFSKNDMSLQHHIADRNYDIANPLPGVAISNQPTPAQTLITSMQSGTPGSGEKFLSLTPHGQYGIGANVPKPVAQMDPTTGEHVFRFPAQVAIDKKAVDANNKARELYKEDHKGQPVTDAAVKEAGYEISPEITIKQPAKQYKLNPNSPTYLSDAAQMAKEQNINLTQLNQIEGVKGGHGQIKQAQGSIKQAASIKIKGTKQRLY